MILCKLLAQGFLADAERLPDPAIVVGLVETFVCQELDFMPAYVMAFCLLYARCL